MNFIVFYKVGMKIKQTILALVLLVGAFGLFIANPSASAATCGGVTTSIINCEQSGGTDTSDTGVWGILLLAINILTAGVGVAAVGGIVYASVLYATSRGSVDQTKKAIVIIQNVVIGIVAYVLMFAFLNYIIPGGLFQK
jgi:hypothetical protein